MRYVIAEVEGTLWLETYALDAQKALHLVCRDNLPSAIRELFLLREAIEALWEKEPQVGVAAAAIFAPNPPNDGSNKIRIELPDAS